VKGTGLPKGVIAVAPPGFRPECALIQRGVWPVAGGDEAGRGRNAHRRRRRVTVVIK